MVVVDVGGATTDVHSVVELDPEDSGLAREVVATTPVTRTVEGDLGMMFGLEADWAANAIAANGNYGEIFAANIGEGTPSNQRTGRRHTYRSSICRRATLSERMPPPTGVVNGPLIDTR